MDAQEKYRKAEMYAQHAIIELQQKFNFLPNRKIEFTAKDCPYDAFYYIYDDTGKIVKQVLIEMKIRDRYYHEVIIESKKIRDIFRDARKDVDVELIYINFFVDYHTLIWKVDKKFGKSTKKILVNANTLDSRKNKKTKSVHFLDTNDGKRIEYKFNYTYVDNYYKRLNEKANAPAEKPIAKGLFYDL